MPGTKNSSGKLPGANGLPALAPDNVEQDSGDSLDDIVPTNGYGALPVVGLGGSAGGLVALQAFFANAKPDSGSAFVVIMHLSPEHESILAELLQRTTRMPVRQVRERIKVEPNHVYVIPPAKNLSMADGSLILSEPGERPGKHIAVDLFFRTLADTHGPHAAAVVLSGADSDGAIGIKRIKERGGLTIAQEPTEAEHEGMPRAAIGTGMVDWVLQVKDIPAKLQDYWNVGARLKLPLEDAPPPATPASKAKDAESAAETALQEVLSYLRMRTGHDFSYYKRATILRRIGRRMQVNGIEDVPAYLAFNRTHPGEPTALLQDLLISVTNFFRDRDAFAAVEELIPALFRGKGPRDTVRVWVAACATGEEAYSFAMLLSEYASTLENPPMLQVFATDLDEGAIDASRDGTYPETIAADVSTERLRRFFNKGHGQYKIKRELREIVLFALHDLLKDSPFSRIDLISCRNLLIYLNRDAQNRALEIFHFALQPEGRLFLGSSESVDDGSALFKIVDKKRRLYLRRPSVRVGLPILTGPSTQSRAVLQRAADARHLPVGPLPAPPREGAPAEGTAVSWSEVHYELIEQLTPPSVIVNSAFEVMHLSENAGRFLQLGGGEPTLNLLRMVHPMLRIELRAALYRTMQTGQPAETRDVPVEIDGQARAVTLRVAPSRSSSSNGLLLVVFEEHEPAGAAPPARDDDAAPESVVHHLERELEAAKAHLRDTVEQADASSEELKASNEELQAMNEELRSATEELETGREELQSINEELTTVNQEMRSKVEELGRSNSDLQNLMASTQIGTVFLDRALCIQRYTPPAVALFNLIPTDVGRPLEHLTPRLNYPNLAVDAERVLDQLGSVELEVEHLDGRSFLARILPYRTMEDHIAGVVLTFVDITERRHAEQALAASLRKIEERGQELQRSNELLRNSEDRYRTLFDSIDEGFCVFQLIYDDGGRPVDYRFAETNPAFERQTGLSNVRGRRIKELVPDHEERWFRIYAEVARTGVPVRVEDRAGPSGRWYDLYALRVGAPEENRVAAVFRDITGRKQAEEIAALLAAVTQDLVRLTDPRELLGAVGSKIGAHLRLSACAFMEIDEAADAATVTHEWHRTNAAGVRGTYRLGDYLSDEFQQASRAGEVFVVRDVAADPRADAEQYARIDIGAFVSVPIVSDGQWRFLLVMFDSAPRDWRDDEIELMRELTSRLWTRLAQARNDEALRASEARLRAVFDSARDFALITTDAAGAITAWNPGAEAIFRAPEAKMRGHHPRELFTPEDRAAGLPERKFEEATDRGHAEYEGWLQRLDGTRFWASGLASALRVEDNPPHGFLKIVRDMSGLHETEQARRESEDRFALVVQSIQDYAIYMLDPKGRVTTWNRGAERIKGYTAEEIIGQSVSFCSTPEDLLSGASQKELEIAAREGRWQQEIWRVRKNGERYWAEELLVALRSDEGQLIAYAKFGRDLSDRKRLEDEHARLFAAEQAARAEAEQSNEAKDRFLAVLSHELRAPLAPVQMALYALNREKRLSARGRESLDMIVRNVDSETKLIDDLLDVSRIVHGKLDLGRRPLDVHACIARAVEVSHADVAAKKLRLIQELGATLTEIDGDAARLQQVFWNLLKNAAKFSPGGATITLRTYDCPDEANAAGAICVEIVDTGIGVAPEALPKLFTAFEQGGADVTRQFGGLGLGLAISHAIVKAHGGEITGKSDGPGQGATFTVRLSPTRKSGTKDRTG